MKADDSFKLKVTSSTKRAEKPSTDDVPVWANEEGFRQVEEDALVPDVDDYIRQEEEK